MSDIKDSHSYPSNTKKLISNAMVLSKRKLNYRFGSGNPRNGAMDCSGTIQYLLRTTANIHSPRDARDLYLWVEHEGRLHHVHAYHFSSSQFHDLKAGDLLFWTGTYRTHRKPPITHVMLYIGKNENNQRLAFGSETGIYNGRLVRGVGVFDFILPERGDRAHFVGYGCIPHYTC
jgi:cell wall-associated NlpC family hydrolase